MYTFVSLLNFFSDQKLVSHWRANIQHTNIGLDRRGVDRRMVMESFCGSFRRIVHSISHSSDGYVYNKMPWSRPVVTQVFKGRYCEQEVAVKQLFSVMMDKSKMEVNAVNKFICK